MLAIVRIPMGEKQLYTIKRVVIKEDKYIAEITELNSTEINIINESEECVVKFINTHYINTPRLDIIIDQVQFAHYKYTNGFAKISDIAARN